MSMNNNNPPNPLGGSPSMYGNVGMMGTGMPGRPAYGQWQSQFGSGFQNQYSLSQAQAAARAQAQVQGHAQAQAMARAIAQAQAARAQYQAHLQAQGVGLSMHQNPAMGGFGGMSSNFLPGGSDDGRFFQKPPPGPPGTLFHRTPSPMSTTELTPAAYRMKQQSPERQPRKKVAALLPESALFTQLLEFENRLDADLINKEHEIQDAMRNPPCVQKILRIYIFNTFANQTPPTAEDADPEPPTWTLKVIGRILEDVEDPNQPKAVQKPNASYPKFSSFFKKVTISLDEQLYPDDHTVAWEQARSFGNHDGFEVKRKGDKEFNARISLELNYTPKKFRLSPDLAALLGFEVATRARIIAAIWHYVKTRNLQDRNDTSIFYCDLPLQKVFGLPKMTLTVVSQKISPHLTPPSPINLEHWVKLSGSSPVGNACYDVLVDLPFPIQKDLANLVNKTGKADEIKACDAAITDSLLKIHEHYKRRAFFLGFSQSPAESINAIIESQSRDLKLVAGESSGSAVKEHVSEFYNQPWVEDAVIRYLNRKQVAEKDRPRRA